MSGNALDDPEIRDAVARGERHLLRADAPVSAWSIRAWCGAMGDLNPVYLDDAAAVRAGFAGIIAPPVMMHSYTMPTLLNPEISSPARRLRQRFATHGFTSVAAVTYEQEYVTPIRIGDLLKREVLISAVSEEKQTALGSGHFITTTHRITNQNDELLGNLLVRVLYFRPRDRAATNAATDKPKSTPASDNSEVASPAGVEIPPLEIPTTTTLIVTTALASNDFEPVHHDRDHAQREGLPDIIMNILTSSGLAMRYVTDWAGPATAMKKLSVRLRAQNCPGDTLVLKGRASHSTHGDATVEVTGSNARGIHVQSTLTVGLRR